MQNSQKLFFSGEGSLINWMSFMNHPIFEIPKVYVQLDVKTTFDSKPNFNLIKPNNNG